MQRIFLILFAWILMGGTPANAYYAKTKRDATAEILKDGNVIGTLVIPAGTTLDVKNGPEGKLDLQYKGFAVRIALADTNLHGVPKPTVQPVAEASPAAAATPRERAVPRQVGEAYRQGVAASRNEMTRKFPDSYKADSPFRKAYDEEVSKARQQEPQIFDQTDWPMVIARRVDAKLKEQEAAAKTAATAELSAKIAQLPQSVDLRPVYQQLELQPRSQGGRGSCTIFGTLGVMEFQLRKRGEAGALSEQFVMWAANQIGRYKRDYFGCEDVIAAIEQFGVCREDLMPYKEWGNIGKPSREAIADASTRKGTSVKWFHKWSGKAGFSEEEIKAISASIADSCPVTATFVWPRTAKLDAGHFLQDQGSKHGSGHVVVLVGYELNPKMKGGGAFIFRQSWGDDWGDKGYAKLTFQYVKDNAQQAYALQIPPLPKS